MNRREAIRNTSLLLGYGLAVGTTAAVMNGCKTAEDPIAYIPEFLSGPQMDIVKQFAERILPKTSTPGAIDAGVHTFIDQAMAKFYDPEEQAAFSAGLASVNAESQKLFTKNFADVEASDQDKVLQALFELSDSDTNPDNKHIFPVMKELTLAGFFTSEVGQMEVLNYNPVPGVYQGCVDYTAGTPMDSSHAGGW